MKRKLETRSGEIAQDNPTKRQEDYNVGYKKPPRETRFQRGMSGNPRGRPKGSPTLKSDSLRTLLEVVQAESKRNITLQQGGQSISLPADQAVIRSITTNAVRGNPSAQRNFLNLQKELKVATDAEWEKKLATLIAYKNGWREVIAIYAAQGNSAMRPDPLPEQIEIDEVNQVAYLLEDVTSAEDNSNTRKLQKRLIDTELYDWLRRNIPDPDTISTTRPQLLVTRDELDRLPQHIIDAISLALHGIQDLREGKILYVKPPKLIYNRQFVTPSGRKLPLSGMRCYPVEADDAELLIAEGWMLVDPDKLGS